MRVVPSVVHTVVQLVQRANILGLAASRDNPIVALSHSCQASEPRGADAPVSTQDVNVPGERLDVRVIKLHQLIKLVVQLQAVEPDVVLVAPRAGELDLEDAPAW